MRLKLAAWVVVSVLWGQVCLAQQPAASAEPNDFKPASSNIINLEYPQVNSPRQVKSRVNAPDAQSVRVSLGNTALTKGEDGVWTSVTPPPGIVARQLDLLFRRGDATLGPWMGRCNDRCQK